MSYPTSEVMGSGRECQAAMAQEGWRGATLHLRLGWRLGGATPPPRGSGCAGTGGPRGAIPRPTLKVRKGGGEEIPLIQSKEQQLRFA